MSACLLDVNVLVALAWPSHVHHAQAHAWFNAHAADGWATCPLTQLGFVRISSHPRIIPEAVSPRQALQLLAQMTRMDRHVFWPDDLSLDDRHIPADLIMGHRQFTDAYLVGLAMRKGGRLVTFDAALISLLPSRHPRKDVVEVISTERS